MQDNKSKLNILHVDDESDTLEVVSAIFEKEGYDVTSVNSGKAAIEKVRDNNYSVIIVDIMMPDMSGWELFTEISKIKPKSKVVFLSILEIAPEKLAEIKKRGVSAYIHKPFDNKELVEVVNKVIESK